MLQHLIGVGNQLGLPIRHPEVEPLGANGITNERALQLSLAEVGEIPAVEY